MTDLTEKWKNKELKWHKSYYCKNKKGEIAIATLMGDDVLYSAELGGTLNFGYWEVLAECDYEELQRLESDRLAKNEGVEIVAELKEENESLKDKINLLKAALKYSNTTAKVALDVIKKYSNQFKLIKAMEEMLDNTQKVLK